MRVALTVEPETLGILQDATSDALTFYPTAIQLSITTSGLHTVCVYKDKLTLITAFASKTNVGQLSQHFSEQNHG